MPDRGGLKKSIGGLESDVVGPAADVGRSADSSFQFADDGVRLKKARGGLRKMSVESYDARFQSAENGGRADDIGVGLRSIGVEMADAGFQSADVGVGLKDTGGRHENVGGRLKKLGGGLKNIGVETTDAGFQPAAMRFQTSASGLSGILCSSGVAVVGVESFVAEIDDELVVDLLPVPDATLPLRLDVA